VGPTSKAIYTPYPHRFYNISNPSVFF